MAQNEVNIDDEDITIKDVFKFMVTFKKEVSTKLDDKIGSLENKIQGRMNEIEEEIGKNQRENKEMFENNERRMRKLEEDMTNMKGPNKGYDTLKKLELEMRLKTREEDDKEERRRTDRDRDETKKRKEEDEHRRRQDEREKNRKNMKNLQKELAEASDRDGQTERTWETQASEWLDRQVRPINTKLRQEDKTRRTKEGRKKLGKLRSWFGTSDTESGEDSEEEKDTWQKISRVEKNEKKKEKMEERKRSRREEVTKKAKNIIGLGPIKKSSIKHFQKAGRNLEDSKEEALKEYMRFYLHYTEKELEEIEIGATQICQKDDFLYVAFSNFEEIKEIHARVADFKDDRIQTRNYIPPQYYERYKFLNKRCQEYRQSDKNKKTQMRFNIDDIEVLIKDKGTTDPYRVISHEEICNIGDIPEYDHKVEWKMRKERRMRNTENSVSPNRGEPPSLASQGTVHPLSRNNSHENAPRKKFRSSEERMDHHSNDADRMEMQEAEDTI